MRMEREMDPKVDGGSHYNKKATKPLSVDNILAAPSLPLVTDEIPNAMSRHPENGWKPFPSQNIPKMFNYGNVYSFLIEDLARVSIGAKNGESSEEEVDTGDCSTEKPLRKGRNLLKSGFLTNVTDNSDHSFYYVSGMVDHSMKNLPPLHVVVTISKASGAVKK